MELQRTLKMLDKQKNLLAESHRIAKMGSWEYDLQNRVLTWSDEIFEILELDPKQTKPSYQTVLDMLHPDDRQAFDAAYQDLVKYKKEYDIESRLQYPGGRIKHMRTIGLVECNVEGIPIRAVGISQDVTKTTRLRQDLLARTEAMDKSVTAMVLTTPEGRLTYVNQATLDMWHEPGKDEVLGKSVTSFWSDPNALRKVVTTLKEVDHYVGEMPAKRRDGSKFTVLFSSGLIRDEAGHITGMIGTFVDISDRKQMEETIRDNARAMNALLGNLPGIAYRCKNDPDWTMEYLSEGCFDLTGYKTEELLNNNVLSFGNLIVDSDKEMVWNEIQRALRAHKPFQITYRIKTKQGKVKWVWEKGSGIFDGKEILGLEGFITDINERKNAEDALKQVTHRLQLVLKSSGDGLFSINTKGRLTMINQAALDMLGYKAEKDLMGKDVHGVHHHSGQDGREYKPEDCSIHHSLKKGSISTVENDIFWRKDGSHFPVEYISAPIVEMGKITGAVVSFRDVSERIRAREIQEHIIRFQKLVVEISSDFVSANSENLDRKINAMLEQIGAFYGVDRSYLFMFSPCRNYMSNTHEWCAPGIGKQMETLQGQPVDSLPWWKEQLYKHKTVHIPDVTALPEDAAAEKEEFGRQDIKSMLSVPIAINRQITGFFGFDSVKAARTWDENEIAYLKVLANTLADAILKVDAEKALIAAKIQAEESDRLKSAFLANMSHEIRTPMNAILGFLELLKQPELEGSEKTEYIGVVNKSARRLLNTINDIVEASKIEAGQAELQHGEVDTAEIMKYYLQLFKQQADDKGIQLHLKDHVEGKGAVITSDKNKLESILGNLLNNAIKFTEKGVVEFGNYINDDSLVFYVRDTGMGIPSDRQDVVFERFVQADLNLTRPYEGSGLGLSIVKDYTRMLGGNLWFESEEGKGSTFCFSIPYVPVKTIQTVREAPPFGSTDIKAGSKILIAEDDDMGYKYYEIILDHQNITLMRTINGMDTVKAVQEDPGISLVLMDVKMPGMNGMEATAAIRKFNKDIPIIAQTAHAMSGDRERLIKAGCNDYLSKPINRSKLMQLVNKYIGK